MADTDSNQGSPWDDKIGKLIHVQIDDFPYHGYLRAVTDHEMHFENKNGQKKVIPRGSYEMTVKD